MVKFKVITCEGCDGFSDPSYPKCRSQQCPSKPKLFPIEEGTELIVFKNKVFTKMHYLKEDDYVLFPFFVDIVLAPVHGRTLKRYKLKDGEVRIVRKKEESIQPTYSLSIPNLNKAFEELWELYRQYNSKDLSNELFKTWIKEKGILDYLLLDPAIQEVNINPPGFETPIRIVHEEFDECVTNIYPTQDFLNFLSTFLKIDTGRPLNKAHPQLDGELIVEKRKGRVAAVRSPFSVYGIGYSIRVHRKKPWTIPLFMENKAINEWFAGLISLAITHGRTIMCAGPRGSGKTSLLGALILEILPKYRIITIEDTQELPIDAYKEMGYDLVPLKVRSALLEHGLEIPFATGLRTSLRMGDSVLIIGEIRSKEAVVLYEAMRIGALSNVVAGTVHADSPYGVYDRVVNDLGVPKGSFKVTDLIIMVKQIKTPTALTRVRRVERVTEVLKEWEDKPVFQDLLVYDPKKDELVPTPALLNGKSYFINNILENTKGYATYDTLMKDIDLRAWAKQKIVDTFKEHKKFLEAPANKEFNLAFVQLFEKFKPLEGKSNEANFKKSFQKLLDKKVNVLEKS